MDYLEFISAIISALAWPIAVVVIVLLLRTEVAGLLARIKKIKYNDSEIDLAEEVIEAENSADRVLDSSSQGSTPEQERIYRLAEDSPRGAILDSWLSVEEAMIGYAKRHGLEEVNFHMAPHHRIQSIRWNNLDTPTLGRGVFEMLDKLRRIRNDAVHRTDAEITPETAKNYASLAARVKEKLEEA